MAIAGMTQTNAFSPRNFFKVQMQRHLRYWEQYVQDHREDVAKLDEAQERIVDVINLSLDQPPVTPSLFDLVENFSDYMERRGHLNTWHSVLIRAVAAASTIDPKIEVRLTAFYARLLLRQNNFKGAISHYRNLIYASRMVGDQFNEARALTNLGYLYTHLSCFIRAEILLHHAMISFDKIDSNFGRAHTANHLGLLYARWGQLEQARLHLEQACLLWPTMNDHYGLMQSYINLGFLFSEMEQPDQVMYYMKQAEAKAEQIGEKIILGIIYLNLSWAFKLHNDFDQMEYYAKLAETTFRHTKDFLRLPLAWLNLGVVYFSKERWREAELYLNQAFRAYEELDYNYGKIRALINKVEFYLAQANYQKALTTCVTLGELVKQDSSPKDKERFDILMQECLNNI